MAPQVYLCKSRCNSLVKHSIIEILSFCLLTTHTHTCSQTHTQTLTQVNNFSQVSSFFSTFFQKNEIFYYYLYIKTSFSSFSKTHILTTFSLSHNICSVSCIFFQALSVYFSLLLFLLFPSSLSVFLIFLFYNLSFSIYHFPSLSLLEFIKFEPLMECNQ